MSFTRPKTPTPGRVQSLDALKAERNTISGPVAVPAKAPAAFRPNVTAFWTPSSRPAPEGEMPPIIRINTPISLRPETPLPGPETPPFGSPIAGEGSGTGVPVKASEGGPSARIPFRVGAYEVATRIAQGGMGSIYICRRADTPQSQRLFTLKVIRQHAVQKEAAIHSFKREARVGALLGHPNAQTVLDVGVYDEQPFLILQYVEGANLSALLSDDAKAPPAAIVTVLLDILRALQHAHGLVDDHGKILGLVHGDVSPDNVLIGVDGVARLTDFGSARFTTETPIGQADGFGLGKPAYMAPEQLLGEPLDGRADLFAVGVVMWSALTGQKLFAADTYDQTVMKVMRKKIPPPSAFGAPACLDDVCLQALSRSPDGRFATADEMSHALMTAAAKADMVASREAVGGWVRREVGETLAERRRRIDLMFGDKVNTPGPLASSPPAGSNRSRPPTATPHVPAQTMQLGAAKAGLDRTVLFPTSPITADIARASSSVRQWVLIIAVSLVAFIATLVVGSFVTRPNAPARRSAPGSSTAEASKGAPPPLPPSTAEQPGSAHAAPGPAVPSAGTGP